MSTPVMQATQDALLNGAPRRGQSAVRDRDAQPEGLPFVSILVVCYNSADFITLCLDSILRNTGYPRCEIIVVDNGSSDGTREILDRYARNAGGAIRCIHNRRNLGFAAATNQALDRARGDYLVFLNPDTVAPPGWLARLVGHCYRDAGVGLVCPTTNFAGNEAAIEVSYRDLPGMEDFAARLAADKRGLALDISMAPLFCAAMPRCVLESVGPLDERFQTGMFEDDDLSLRIKRAGYRVLCAEDCFVHHFGYGSFGVLTGAARDEIFAKNRSAFEAKWNVAWKPARFRPGVRPPWEHTWPTPAEFCRSEEPPKVSVLIVSCAGRQYFPGCLGSLRRQTYRNLEVVVVDNGSSDGGPEFILEHFAEVKVVQAGRNLGFAAGNNWGLQFVTGDLVLFLNDDTELAADFIERLVDALHQDETAAGACGKIYSLSNKSTLLWTLPKIDHRTGEAVWIRQESGPRAVDYLPGNSMMLRKRILDQVGPLDIAYEAYYEETDLCARIIRAGHRLLYVPAARVWHKEMGSAAPEKNYFLMRRNQLRFALKNFDVAYMPRFFVLYLARLLREARANRKRSPSYNELLWKGLLWNILELPKTWRARRRDLGQLTTRSRSYNRSLPLRGIRSIGSGGFENA